MPMASCHSQKRKTSQRRMTDENSKPIWNLFFFSFFSLKRFFYSGKKGKNFPRFLKGFVFHFSNYWNIIRFDIFLPCKNLNLNFLRLKRYTLNILFRNFVVSETYGCEGPLFYTVFGYYNGVSKTVLCKKTNRFLERDFAT